MPSGIVEIKKNENVKFKGYVTAPAKGVFPGILLLHQEFGIDVSVRFMAEYFASLNYTVFVPDLFWRNIPGCELSSNEDQDIDESQILLNTYDCEEGLEDVTMCLKWLRETPQCNGLVATIGYGIGSNLSYLAGLWLDVETSVCYDFYGTNFFRTHDTFIRRPMLIHLSEKTFSTLKKNEKLEYLSNIKNIELKLHKKTDINFFRNGDKNFNNTNASLANKITEKHILQNFNNPYST